MDGVVRGEEEEVFETPDIALSEDGIAMETGGPATKDGRNDNVNKVADAEVVSSFVPPQTAFEVFMGKTYAGPREDMSDAIGAAVRAADGAVYTAKGYRRDTADDAAGDTRTGMDAPGGASKDRKAISAERRSALVRERTGESPVQWLLRLREETALLTEDLEEMSKVRRKGSGGGDTSAGGNGDDGVHDNDADDGDAGGYALWSAMAKETEALQRQLAALSGDPRYKHIVSPTPRTAASEVALQQRLSEGVIRALERLREEGAVGGATAESKSATPGGAAPSSIASAQAEESVTFELFLKEASEARGRLGATRTGETGLSVSGVETRIAALEKALGGTGGVRSIIGGVEVPPQSLTDAVSTLEKRVSLLEPGRLDGLRQKAMLARAELDALAKSRISASSTAAGSSSSSSSSSPGSSAATAAGAAGAAGGAGGISDMSRQKKVDAAFNTLQTWQGLATGLPLLVDRLRALETLHLASASFAQRLEQMEGSQAELVSVLTSTAEGLEATRTSATENVAIVEENIRALDKRLAGVGLS